MFFKESEHLLQQHKSLKGFIVTIDNLLSKFDSQALARVTDFADIIGASPNQVSALFSLYEKEGVLKSIDMVICDACETLSPATERRICESAGDEYLCVQCGENLVEQNPRHLRVFQLTEHALHKVKKNTVDYDKVVKHLVLLIHGIRTDGIWQERVAAELDDATPLL